MITLKNPLAASEWIINLKEYPQVENSLPMAGLNVRNDSNIVAYVDLDGLKVGEVQRYSADPFQGRNYSLIRIYNPDGQDFAADDLFVQITKGEVMGSQPFNPQWDMMFNDLDRFATGTDSRIALKTGVDMDKIKYYLNAQNALIVQRRIDVQAHATLLGAYEIEFGPTDILSGAVGVGVPPPPDTLLYKKTISDECFNWSETNAEIVGYVADFKKANDAMTLATVDYSNMTYGGEDDPLNCFDDDMSTAGTNHFKTTTYTLIFEATFPERSLSEAHLGTRLAYGGGTGVVAYLKTQLRLDGVWTTIDTDRSAGGGSGTVWASIHLHDMWAKATGFKLWVKGSNASYNCNAHIYDITLF